MAAKGRNKRRARLLKEREELRKRSVVEHEAATAHGPSGTELAQRANRTLDAIRIITGLASKDKAYDTILCGMCDGLAETQGYHGVWIAVLGEEGAVTVAESGALRDAPESANRGKIPACALPALSQSQLLVVDDPAPVGALCPALVAEENLGLLCVRLERGGKPLGLLGAYAPRTVIQDCREQALFQELARHLAFGLTNLALRRAHRALDVNARIARLFVTFPDDRFYREALQVLLDATSSPHGVFGYIDETGAFVVPNVPRSAEDSNGGQALVFPADTWGNAAGQRALREKRSIWANDVSAAAPESILTVRRQISVPVIHEGEVVGLVQVANKETNYTTSDIELVEDAVRALAPALGERLRRERNARERARAEETQDAVWREMEAVLRDQADELGRVRSSLQKEAANRERAEERTRRYAMLSHSVSAVFQDTLACQDDEDLARACLVHAQRLTKSAYGYFARVNPKGRFDVIALASSDRDTRAKGDVEPIARMENVEIRGVWGKVLRGGEAQIINNLDAPGERVKMLEGTPPLTSFMSVPVRLSGTVVGAIALANKPSGFDDIDLDMMEGLSQLFAEALRLHLVEAALSEARREIARRDSLGLLGQLGGEVAPQREPSKCPPTRRSLLSRLIGRIAGRQELDDALNELGSRHCSVLIASSRPSFQEAVRRALANQDRITVLEESADLDEEGILTARGTNPEIIVVDLGAAGPKGFRTIGKIREQTPDARIVAVSPYAVKDSRHIAPERAPHRLLLGDFEDRDLVEAIRGLMAPQ